MGYLDIWTLETIFAGGVTSESFKMSVTALNHTLEELVSFVDRLAPIGEDVGPWQVALSRHQDLKDAVSTPISFTGCWSAVRSKDAEVRIARQGLLDFYSKIDECWVKIVQQIDSLSDGDFEVFISPLDEQAPALRRVRSSRHLRGGETTEILIAQLNPQALHGWGNLYNLVAGRLQATYKREGEEDRVMGISEVSALLANANEDVRKAAFLASTEAWKTEQDVCALALNQITETRKKRNRRAGVDELEHTLDRNRLEREALDAMWAACSAARPALLRYLDRKNQLSGKETLHPWNVRAPLQLEEEPPLSWEKTCREIIASFGNFDPDMAAFADRALREGWVDAVPGPNRRMGGFCTGVQAIQESRIFMTFSGTSRSAMTLAHELGHAWHNDILFDQAPPRRSITSSTAESASTFGEALFRDHLYEQASNDAIRIQMLDQQLMAGVSFLIALPIRFEFERALYPLADKGPFNPADLTRIWNHMWRKGFGGRLDKTDTLGWCSTLHYYISHFGFYNWPYTFGYLFSGHIYQQAKAEGPAFQKTMQELLIATGCMNTVPLAQSILGVDLRDPKFWTQSIQPLLDIEQLFMALTDPLVSDKKLEA